MNRITSGFVSVIALLLITGCVTPGDPTGYRDVSEVDTRFMTASFDPIDYNSAVTRMVESILNRVPLSTPKPLFVLGNVFYDGPHRLDRELLLTKIETEMNRSNKIRFSTATSEFRKGGQSGDAYRQLMFQNESGYVEEASIQRYGEILGAEYIMYAFVSSIERRSGSLRQVYWSITVRVTSVRTAELFWSEEWETMKVIDMARR